MADMVITHPYPPDGRLVRLDLTRTSVRLLFVRLAQPSFGTSLMDLGSGSRAKRGNRSMNTNYHDTVITTYRDATRIRFVGEPSTVHLVSNGGDMP